MAMNVAAERQMLLLAVEGIKGHCVEILGYELVKLVRQFVALQTKAFNRQHDSRNVAHRDGPPHHLEEQLARAQ